jgi:hypothetical protein
MLARIDPHDILHRVCGLLTVERLARIAKDRRGKSLYFYDCSCSCGGSLEVVRGNLMGKHTRSCGCLKQRAAQANPGWTGCGKISGYLWAQIKSKAQRSSRTLPFTITVQDAWGQFEKQEGCCALTGWALSIEHSSKRRSTRTASLDRIDSARGYEPDNIQWVHKDVNQMKWDLPNSRFIEICRAVADRMKSEPVLLVAV